MRRGEALSLAPSIRSERHSSPTSFPHLHLSVASALATTLVSRLPIMDSQSQSSSGVPPSTASFLDKVHQSRPHEHGDVAFNPGANLAQTRLSEGMRRQEVVSGTVVWDVVCTS